MSDYTEPTPEETSAAVARAMAYFLVLCELKDRGLLGYWWRRPRAGTA